MSAPKWVPRYVFNGLLYGFDCYKHLMRQQLGPIYPTYATFCSFHFCWLESQKYWMSSWNVFKAECCFQLNLLLIKLTFYLKRIILHKQHFQMHNHRIILDIAFSSLLRFTRAFLQTQTSGLCIISVSWWKWVIRDTEIDIGFYQYYAEILLSVLDNMYLCYSSEAVRGESVRATVWASMFKAEAGLRPQISRICNQAAKIQVICVLAWKSTCNTYLLELTRKEFPDHCCALILNFKFAQHEFEAGKDCCYSDQIKNRDIHKQLDIVWNFDLAFEAEKLVISNVLVSLLFNCQNW